jgi:hypothetical protein
MRHLLFLRLFLGPLLPAAALAAPTDPAGRPTMRFQVKTPAATQELKVVRTTEKSLTFELNISGACQRTMTGEARLKGGAPKIVQDEKGRSYPAEEFVYLSDGCGLVVRLKVKDARRATVGKAGACHATCAPLADVMVRADSPPGTPHKKPTR